MIYLIFYINYIIFSASVLRHFNFLFLSNRFLYLTEFEFIAVSESSITLNLPIYKLTDCFIIRINYSVQSQDFEIKLETSLIK